MSIVPGNYYRMRDGGMAYVREHRPGSNYPMHGDLYRQEIKRWELNCWTEDGYYDIAKSSSRFDIVEPVSDAIDTTKPLTTRGGYAVKIYDVFEGQDFPIVGAVFMKEGWIPHSWTRRGHTIPAGGGSLFDLVYARGKEAVYLNIYEVPDGSLRYTVHKNRTKADSNANHERVSRIRVDFEKDRWDD